MYKRQGIQVCSVFGVVSQKYCVPLRQENPGAGAAVTVPCEMSAPRPPLLPRQDRRPSSGDNEDCGPRPRPSDLSAWAVAARASGLSASAEAHTGTPGLSASAETLGVTPGLSASAETLGTTSGSSGDAQELPIPPPPPMFLHIAELEEFEALPIPPPPPLPMLRPRNPKHARTKYPSPIHI